MPRLELLRKLLAKMETIWISMMLRKAIILRFYVMKCSEKKNLLMRSFGRGFAPINLKKTLSRIMMPYWYIQKTLAKLSLGKLKEQQQLMLDIRIMITIQGVHGKAIIWL
jgi:hypothetical protein